MMSDQSQNILEWAMANVFQTQQAANNATINKNLNANAAPIPFGSTVTTTNNVTTGTGKLAQAALTAFGIGAAGLGLWKLAGPELSGGTKPPADTPPAVTVPAGDAVQPVIIEGVLEWSIDPDGNGRIDGIRANASVPAGVTQEPAGQQPSPTSGTSSSHARRRDIVDSGHRIGQRPASRVQQRT